MIRVFFFAAIPAVLVVLLWDDAPQWAVLAGWALGGSVLAYGWYRGALVLRCPYCQKRVKIGAQACHHCGRVVTNTRAPGYRHDPFEISRECPHCKSAIRPDASVCPSCQRDVRPWELREGSWWDIDADGLWVRLDQRQMRWIRGDDSTAR